MSTIAPSELPATPPLTFSIESGAVLQRLRTTISEMLNTMPGRVRSTRDLQKLFGLDLKLCWQLMKLAGPGDALSLAPFVPTAGPMRRFLTAASSYGISESVLKDIRLAYSAFEEQVALHAGDRMTFESMATGSVGNQDGSAEDLRRSDLKLRKAGFQMHSHYCGVQMDTYLSASILHPGELSGQFDLAHLRVKLGQRRLRAGAPFQVDSFKYSITPRADQEIDKYERESFDPESLQKFGAPILPQFCSHPLPQFETVTNEDGKTTSSIIGDEIGLKSSVNLTFGRLIRNVPMETTADGMLKFGQWTSTAVPMVMLIADQLVHRPTFPKVEFESTVHWASFRHDVSARQDSAQLPFRERIVRLEAGVDGARTREVPQYIDMLSFICDKMKWKIEDFDVYRIRIEYPLVHTNTFTDFKAAPVWG